MTSLRLNPRVSPAVTTIPVLYSTFACAGLVDEVLPRYSIGTVTDCQFWNRGLSDVYMVEATTGTYILRISHSQWRSRHDVEFELSLLEFLHQHSIPVAYPLRTRRGELLIPVQAPEGDRFASLFICAPGQVPVGDFSAAQSHRLGATVAEMHQVGTAFQGADLLPRSRPGFALDREEAASQVLNHTSKSVSTVRQLDLSHLLDRSWARIEPLLQPYPRHLEDLQTAIAQIRQTLIIPQEAPYWGICWGDPHSGNVHFTPDQQLMLFDFDQCGYGWRVFEIAKFYHTAISTGIPRNIREAFLAGYQSVQPLTAQELGSLQLLTQAAHIWQWAISLNYAAMHSFSRLDHYYFTSRIEQLKRLQSHDWQLF